MFEFFSSKPGWFMRLVQWQLAVTGVATSAVLILATWINNHNEGDHNSLWRSTIQDDGMFKARTLLVRNVTHPASPKWDVLPKDIASSYYVLNQVLFWVSVLIFFSMVLGIPVLMGLIRWALKCRYPFEIEADGRSSWFKVCGFEWSVWVDEIVGHHHKHNDPETDAKDAVSGVVRTAFYVLWTVITGIIIYADNDTAEEGDRSVGWHVFFRFCNSGWGWMILYVGACLLKCVWYFEQRGYALQCSRYCDYIKELGDLSQRVSSPWTYLLFGYVTFVLMLFFFTAHPDENISGLEMRYCNIENFYALVRGGATANATLHALTHDVIPNEVRAPADSSLIALLLMVLTFFVGCAGLIAWSYECRMHVKRLKVPNTYAPYSTTNAMRVDVVKRVLTFMYFLFAMGYFWMRYDEGEEATAMKQCVDVDGGPFEIWLHVAIWPFALLLLLRMITETWALCHYDIWNAAPHEMEQVALSDAEAHELATPAVDKPESNMDFRVHFVPAPMQSPGQRCPLKRAAEDAFY